MHERSFGNLSARRFVPWTRWCLLLYLSFIILPRIVAQETYSDASCNAVTSTMMSCAGRWDAIRTNCTNSVTSNTIWPGPCECSYYANDMPCFDDQALCADQVWTQLPQWFRDGVTSCLMKDESYTIRAALGGVQNPFLMTGVAGNATRVTVSATNSATARTGSSADLSTASSTGAVDANATISSTRLPTGTKIGIGVGVSTGVAVIVALVAWILWRRRTQTAKDVPGDESRMVELDSKGVELHEAEVEQYSKHELAGYTKPEIDGTPRWEMEGSATREAGRNAIQEVEGVPRNEVEGNSIQRYELG